MTGGGKFFEQNFLDSLKKSNKSRHLDTSLRDFIVEILRGVSAGDQTRNEYEALRHLTDFLEAIIEHSEEISNGVLHTQISDIIKDLRKEEASEHLKPQDRLASVAGKVLAERASGVMTQQQYAERRFRNAFEETVQGLAEKRRERGFK